ncbi:Ku protein [Streptomyces decoyicus]|uniref:Ku protein n=1 Tax=Streptomyces decoyicus TaxID=249567 RepID=UPI003908085C
MGVEGAGAHPYRLLRDAMKQSGQVGVARVALRGPERLVVLREQPQARNISAHAEMGARYSPTSTPPRTKPGAWRMLPARWGSRVRRGTTLDRREEFLCRVLRICRSTRVVTAFLLRVIEAGEPEYNSARA